MLLVLTMCYVVIRIVTFQVLAFTQLVSYPTENRQVADVEWWLKRSCQMTHGGMYNIRMIYTCFVNIQLVILNYVSLAGNVDLGQCIDVNEGGRFL